MLVEKDRITEFIPQRSPIVMIDQLLAADEKMAKTDFLIQIENVLVTEGCLSEAGLIENIAQTAMVKLGYWSHHVKLPVPLGFLAAIKDLKIYRLPVAGNHIHTTIQITNQIGDFTILQGEVREVDELLCSCEMRIFIKTDS